MVRAIIHKWRKLVTVLNLPSSGQSTKITPRAQWRLIQKVIKEPRNTSKELQASLASIKVIVHDSTIRKRLGKNDIHGRVPRRKPLLTKKNTKARLTHQEKKILFIPNTFGLIFCGLMRQKLKFWKVCPVTSDVKQTQHFIKRSSNKQSNMVEVVWWSGECFADSGTGQLVIIYWTMNSALYQKILKENVHLSVCDLKLKHTWVMLQDSDPKHTSKCISEWLKKN